MTDKKQSQCSMKITSRYVITEQILNIDLGNITDEEVTRGDVHFIPAYASVFISKKQEHDETVDYLSITLMGEQNNKHVEITYGYVNLYDYLDGKRSMDFSSMPNIIAEEFKKLLGYSSFDEFNK